jgi:hypothetical protein
MDDDETKPPNYNNGGVFFGLPETSVGDSVLFFAHHHHDLAQQ